MTIECYEFPSAPVSTSLNAFPCLFECLRAILWCYKDKEWIAPPHVLSSRLYKAYKPLLPCLYQQGLCKLHIKSSTWHSISTILTTFLDPTKCCRNYVEAGTKWPKHSKLSSRAKNWCTWENNISPLTGLLTLIFGWHIL